MVAVDTSVLVRYLVADDPDAGAAAARLIDGETSVGLSLVAIAETAFVLYRHYRVPREVVVDSLVDLLRKRNVQTMGADKALVASSLLLCRPSGRVSFADALIHADARSAGLSTLYTFDERFPGDGLNIQRPE